MRADAPGSSSDAPMMQNAKSTAADRTDLTSMLMYTVRPSSGLKSGPGAPNGAATPEPDPEAPMRGTSGRRREDQPFGCERRE